MVAEPTRFTFSFAELASPAAEPSLRVLASSSLALPGGAERVAPSPRPRWMPRLLPVFQAHEPARFDVLGAAAPPFGARLAASLGAIFASAGAEAGIRVVAWPSGIGVGGEGVSEAPHALVVAAALERRSVEAAAEQLRALDPERSWLVLDGDVPAADAALGLEGVSRLVAPARLVRLPLLGRGDLAALAQGREPGMARRATGLRYLDLAARLTRAYLELLP